uniref:Cycloidea-like protein n=1 Tax=Calendula officinalis TaxID=41496 RepID=A0A346D3L9_CALOF|nr:cycloidea-like protein [Calendula officinalis]
MFSSNPFQQLPSTTYPVLPPTDYILGYEKDGFHLDHNNHFVNGGLAPLPAVTDYAQQQHLSLASLGLRNCDDCRNPYDDQSVFEKNMRKDGQGKIHTDQGPRHRRVRLSIDIAKKFFHLQDLLGYDKASKTIDWLLSKSKSAIKELVEDLKHTSFSGADQRERTFQETIRRSGSDVEDRGENEGKKKKSTRKYKSGADVNQSRAEARARARERTKHKMLNKKRDYNSNNVPEDCYTPTSSVWSQIEPQNGSITSSMLHGYQHNLNVYSDLSSQIKYTNFLNLQ